MRRDVSVSLSIEIDHPSELVLAIAAARTGATVDEAFVAQRDGDPVEAVEITDSHGTRLHRIGVRPGVLEVTYRATLTGRSEVPDTRPRDLIRYLRPSRYAESDELAAVAEAEFAGLADAALLDAVSSWVGTRLSYVPGSSQPTDGATQTFLTRQGVCRDYAHLCIALLRAQGVPARLVSVYAPGLDPMDFHAVCEAHVDGRWRVVDATALAPRQSMVRIATGRDAADTAFLSTFTGVHELHQVRVSATADVLPTDDVGAAVELG